MMLLRASLGIAALALCAVPLLVYSIPPQVAAPAAAAVAGGDLNLTFTTIDVPGAIATDVYGLNTTGDTVGAYTALDGSTGAFLLSGGIFTLFVFPGTSSYTFATGINDAGLISGWAFVSQDTGAVGFTYDKGSFTTIRVPGQNATIVDGINNTGIMVGADGMLGATAGFELVGSTFRKVSPPGAYTSVNATGINNVGEIVGWTNGGLGSNHGFTFSHGRFRAVSVPGANDLTEAWGINDNGVVVGWYEKCSPCADHGFVFSKGKYLSLDYPGATGTYAFGINGSGQVVGTYTLPGEADGFITTPVDISAF